MQLASKTVELKEINNNSIHTARLVLLNQRLIFTLVRFVNKCLLLKSVRVIVVNVFSIHSPPKYKNKHFFRI